MDPKEPIWLYDEVTADSQIKEKHTFRQDATITGLWARNYIGHGFDLRYYFHIEDEEGKTRNLISHLGNQFISGDGDNHNPTVRHEVKEGETLIIKAVNTTGQGSSDSYLYHANAYVEVDKEGDTINSLASKIAAFLGGGD